MTTTETTVKPAVTANGTKPAWEGGRWPDESIVKLNLWQRLLLAQRSAKGLAKHGTAPQIMGGFHFATDADVADAVRDYLSGFGIVYLPSLAELVNIDAGATSTNKPIYRTDVKVTLTLKNADRPEETEVVMWHGRGDDTADKGIGKAGTSAVKNAFIKLLNLQGDPSQDPDGADPTGGADRAGSPSADWRPVSSAPQMGPSHYSDVPCPQPGCTGKLVQRDGTHGEFVSCTMYKSCGIKPIDGTLEEYQAREREMADVVDAPSAPAPELPDPSLPDTDYIKATWKKVTSNIRLDAFGTGDLVRCLSQNSKKVWVLTDQAAEDLRSEPSDRVRAVADFFRAYLARQAAG